MWEIHRWPVNFPHKWPVTRKMFPFDDVIMLYVATSATHWRPGARQWNLRMTVIKWVVGNGRHGVMPCIRFQWVIIVSDNGMWIVWRQTITWITDDLLSIILFGTHFSEILIKIKLFYWRKWIWKWRPFCLGLIVHQQSQCCKIR